MACYVEYQRVGERAPVPAHPIKVLLDLRGIALLRFAVVQIEVRVIFDDERRHTIQHFVHLGAAGRV